MISPGKFLCLTPRIVWQEAGVGGGRGASMLETINRVARGTNNLDMTPNEFLTHVRADQQQYFLERLREYEAMLQMVGLLLRVVGSKEEQDAVRSALTQALSAYFSTLEVRDPTSPNHPGAFVSPGEAIFANLQEFFGYEEAAARTRRASQVANATRLEMQLRIGEIIIDLLTSLWNSLVEWWNEFWRIYRTEGLLIAMNRLRIDATFLAAEIAVDVAVTFATAGAGAALAGALKGLRIVAMRTSRATTRVIIKAIPKGRPNASITTLMQREIRDADIDPSIDQIVDEDRFGGAAPLNDTAARTQGTPPTSQTTQVQGGQGPPPTRNPPLTAADREALRRSTPTRAIRDQVNEGQPIATPQNPQPDQWLPGLQRTARLEADHIVPASRIMDMNGFSDLTTANREAVLNIPENFHGMSRSANGSRGNLPFSEWTQHQRTGTAVNETLRQRMILEEARMTEVIQQRIYELLRQQNATPPGPPFRD
jgi:hypothetical protein